MCRRLVLLVVVLGVIIASSSAASAAIITGVVRANGATDNQAPIGAYNGSTAPLATQAGGLMDGNLVRSDRNHTWANTPAQFVGAEYVRTFNSDKTTAGVTYAVTFSKLVTIGLAVDDRFSLQSTADGIVSRFAAAGTFTDTGLNVYIYESASNPNRPMSVFSAVFPAGTYTFGGQGNANNFYTIIALPGPDKAWNPTPADDTMVDADSVILMWAAGGSAALHDVYFSDNFDDVNTADSSDPMGSDKVYKARQTELKYPPGDWDTIPLTRDKTYYWRIDEVNGVNTWRGDIWSFDVVSSLNWNPRPLHQARFVPVTTDLSWSKGALALLGHIVYFSTDFNIVNNAVPGTTTGAPGYLAPTPPETVTSLTRTIPGDLLKGTTYYWRADAVEKNTPLTVHKGEVWQFETMPDILITDDPTLIGLWTFDEGASAGDTVVDWSGYGNHGAIAGGAQRAPGQIEDAIELNGSGQNVAIANFNEIADAGGAAWPEISIAMWAKPDTVSGQRMMWFTHETSGFGKTRCRIDGGTWQFRHGQSSTGTNVDAIGPAAVAGEWVHYAAIRKNNDALYVYINGVLGGSAAFTTPGNPAVTSWIGDEGGTANHFGGLLDDVRVYNKALSVGEIRILAGLLEAYDPLPADQASGVSTTPTLDWLPGARAASHNVYFGTVYADVKAGTGGTFKGNQPLGDTDYAPSPALTAGKLYYWKITEVNDLHADKKWEGPVWAFRVAGGAGGLLGAYYQHTGGAAPAGFETFKLSRIDPEINFGWGTGSPDPLVDINDFSCRWSGQVEAKYSEDYIFYTASDDGARLWVDGQLVIDHWVDQGGTEWASSPIALVAGQKYDIKMEQYENEGGATAYLRWSSPSISKRIIPAIWLWPPTKATNPVPPDGSTGAPPQQPTLSWTAGVYAAAANGHRVYFDADQAKVIARAGCQVNGTSTTNPSYLLPWTFGLEETYYWAVDEVNGVNSWPGDVWSFTTANNKVIDDMELYPPNVQDANIYQVWIDGAGDCGSIPGNNSGALVDISTLAGLAPVHGGQQAMKLLYDNDGTVNNPCPPGLPTTRLTYSKAEALVSNLPSGIGSDWTVGGVAKMLSLWFYGDPLNSIEPMWVQLTDASNNKFKVLYGAYADEAASDVNEASWHEWLIDLADFTGVTVSNVKSIAIGIGNEGGPAGGSGTLYFDDIRLYTPQCVLTRRSADFAALDYAPEASGGDCVINARELEVMTRDWLLTDTLIPAEPLPGSSNLMLHYKFEMNMLDSSTNGLNGTAGGFPTYELRTAGDNAIVLAGSDYVNCGNPPQLDFSTGNWTIAAWIKPIATTDQRMIYCKGGDDTGGIRYMLTLAETNDHRMTVTTDDNVDKYQRHGDIRVDDGEWHHVVGMRDGTALRVYVDGADDGATTIPAGYDLSGTSQADAFIGANWNYATSVVQKFFIGAIDEVRIYNTALSQGQIVNLMGLAQLHIPTPSPAEIGGDEAQGSMVINFKDYAVLADRWLEEELYP